ncbi:hypothetical protein Hanom_Chr11g01057601 [Helianthus anomalus]
MLKADVCDFRAVKEADQGVFVAQEVEKQDVKETVRMIDGGGGGLVARTSHPSEYCNSAS